MGYFSHLPYSPIQYIFLQLKQYLEGIFILNENELKEEVERWVASLEE
jgi:hypothetical protein